MRIRLCAAGQQLREQIDDAFPDRDRTSDGWIRDAKHAARKSDHNPTATKFVRAYDFNADLGSSKHEAYDLADQLRLLARSDKRISYIIFNGKIASYKRNYKWRKYTGINPHEKHIHVSFTSKGDLDDAMFRIPILTGEPINGTSESNRRKLGKIIPSRRISDLSSGGMATGSCPQCGSSSRAARSFEIPQPSRRFFRAAMTPNDWAGLVLAILSCCALIVGGLRYIIHKEVPALLEASNIVSRIEKLESMVLELLTNDRKKTKQSRARR